MTAIELFALPGIPEIAAGDDLGALVCAALERLQTSLVPGDIIVVAQKAVSKCEGRLRQLADYTPSPRALALAQETGKDARKVEAILLESSEVIRAARIGPEGLLIVRHKQGWICANAGIDESNAGAEAGTIILLPEDADLSARRLRQTLEARYAGPIGVVVTDTFGRPWRQGQVNVAIGVAGIAAYVDWNGRLDAFGRPLHVTQPAFADEIAAAAGLLMQKDAGLPVAVLRGMNWVDDPAARATDILRRQSQELFL